MTKDNRTPLQKLLHNLHVGLRVSERSARQQRQELERLQREEPEFYAALIAARARLKTVAEAMYPPEEEHKRLLELKEPRD